MNNSSVPAIVWTETESIGVPMARPCFPHTWVEFPYTAAEHVKERIERADILIVNKVRIGVEQLNAAPKLKMIAITATGTDNVDIAACTQRGIVVRNVVNYGADSVAEHVLACILTLTRRLNEWQARVHDGTWSASRFFCLHTYPMRPLSEQTLVIVGSGSIGSATARMASAFGTKVIYAERAGASVLRPGFVPFARALEQADIVSLHCPLNEQTRGVFNRELFSSMKPGVVIVNTARGGLINLADLYEALETGQVGAAALDVLDVEPPAVDHLMVKARHPRLLITPHIAWATVVAQTNLVNMVKSNIERYFADSR
jgi:glycerate dehydrogenase